MPILTSTDKPTYYSEVTAVAPQLDGLLAIAQAMCESSYGADRPLDITTFTDIVQVYSSGIAFIKRSPIIAITSVSARSGIGNEWQLLDVDSYSIDIESNQVNFKSFDYWGSKFTRSQSMEAKITYSSGFDFTTTTQEVKNIKSICGRIVSYMNQKVAIGQAAVTDSVGFQSFVSGDNFLGLFLLPLAKYKIRG